MTAAWKVGIAAALIMGYLTFPAPEPSKTLQGWIDSGQYFTYNTHKIFFKNAIGRRSDGPALLLLHGFPTNSYDFLKVLPALQDKFSRVILFDFIGFGYSDKPTQHKYSIMEQADIAEVLLSQLKITSTHILAHDYGDTVAQEMLARYEERKAQNKGGLELQSVCLLNGGIFPETNFPLASQQLLLINHLGNLLSHLSNRFSFKHGLSKVFGPKTQPTAEEISDWWTALRNHNGNAILHDLIQYVPERRENRDRWVGALQKATIPVQMIYGPSDPVNPPAFVEHYVKLIPKPRITVLEEYVGHYPQWEEPRATIRAYLDFLKALPYGSSKPTH